MMSNKIKIKEESTIFGKVWYISNSNFKFAIYRYDDDPKTIYLSNVFVNENSRKQGYGNQILDFVDGIAERFTANTIILKANKQDFVHNWYTRHGYFDYEEDFDDYIWMKKTI